MNPTPSDSNPSDASWRPGAAGLATVTLALLVWPIGFNLGAYGVVFYADIFAIVVATSATLVVAMLLAPPGQRPPWYITVALAAPAGWLIAAVTLFDSVSEAARSPGLGAIGLGVVVISLPVIMRTLLRLFNPELSGPRSLRVRVGTVAIILGAALAGFVVGANNDAFLFCEDFKVAGADLPPNCTKP